jgi:hypothetical protein
MRYNTAYNTGENPEPLSLNLHVVWFVSKLSAETNGDYFNLFTPPGQGELDFYPLCSCLVIYIPVIFETRM